MAGPIRAAGLGDRLAAALLPVLGVALSMVAFLYLGGLARSERADTLRRHAEQQSHALTAEMGRHLVLMQAFRSRFEAAAVVSRQEFAGLVGQLLPNFPSLRAVVWMPRVPAAEVQSFVGQARATVDPGFRIEPPPQPGQDRDLYPVLFAAPRTGNDGLVGADVTGLPDRWAALQAAIDRAAPAATARLKLLQEPDGAFSFILYLAAYRDGPPPETVTERRRRALGFIGASFRLDRLAAGAFGHAEAEADVFLLDESAPLGERLLHHRPGPNGGQALAEDEIYRRAAFRDRIEVGGRDWALLMVPVARGFFVEYGVAAWVALLAGLLATAALVTFTRSTLARAQQLEAVTRVTSDSNAALRREITERRTVQEALRQSEERLRLAIRSAPFSLFSNDRQLRFTWVHNSRLGLAPAEMVGKTDAEVMGAANGAVLMPIKQRVIDTRTGIQEEATINLGGRDYHMALTIEPLFDSVGAVIGVIGTGIDITEERHNQEILAAARAEAEKANQAKSRFLAAASHDLRQPLQATRLFLEVLRVQLEDPRHLAVADKAMMALSASDGLLNALLDISTLEAGVVTPEIRPVALEPLLRRLGEEFAAQAEVKGLDFRLRLSEAVAATDPVLLERMVRNLLSNALRYTLEGGILLGCRRRRGRLAIEVWDTGIGVPSDKIEAIFEDFYQLENPERDRTKGLGLGLSVVERMARLLGHHVEVRSRPGHGSVFAIELDPVTAVSPRPGCAVMALVQ